MYWALLVVPAQQHCAHTVSLSVFPVTVSFLSPAANVYLAETITIAIHVTYTKQLHLQMEYFFLCLYVWLFYASFFIIFYSIPCHSALCVSL